MRNDEREMLRSGLQRVLIESEPGSVGKALREFGWIDLLLHEPAEAVASLFEFQGATSMTSPMLDVVMFQPLADLVGTDLTKETVGLIAPGPSRGTLPTSLLADGAVAIDGIASAEIGTCDWIAVPAIADGELVVVIVDGPLDTLSCEPVSGLDPWLRLHRIGGTVTAHTIVRGGEAAARWSAATAAGRRALAHELVGGARAMLALAVEHASTREQFGRAVGTFQALKHRMADAKVNLTAAEAAVQESWVTMDATSALLAKLWAGRASGVGAKHAQQVLAGMGFTWEHPFHRYLRRAVLLDATLGSSRDLAVELGARLVRDGLPQVLVDL